MKIIRMFSPSLYPSGWYHSLKYKAWITLHLAAREAARCPRLAALEYP